MENESGTKRRKPEGKEWEQKSFELDRMTED